MALRQPVQAAPSQEEIARCKDLVRRHGGSSWSGASHSGFGGSDPA
jgi:hypothetical protein